MDFRNTAVYEWYLGKKSDLNDAVGYILGKNYMNFIVYPKIEHYIPIILLSIGITLSITIGCLSNQKKYKRCKITVRTILWFLSVGIVTLGALGIALNYFIMMVFVGSKSILGGIEKAHNHIYDVFDIIRPFLGIYDKVSAKEMVKSYEHILNLIIKAKDEIIRFIQIIIDANLLQEFENFNIFFDFSADTVTKMIEDKISLISNYTLIIETEFDTIKTKIFDTADIMYSTFQQIDIYLNLIIYLFYYLKNNVLYIYLHLSVLQYGILSMLGLVFLFNIKKLQLYRKCLLVFCGIMAFILLIYYVVLHTLFINLEGNCSIIKSAEINLNPLSQLLDKSKYNIVDNFYEMCIKKSTNLTNVFEIQKENITRYANLFYELLPEVKIIIANITISKVNKDTFAFKTLNKILDDVITIINSITDIAPNTEKFVKLLDQLNTCGFIHDFYQNLIRNLCEKLPNLMYMSIFLIIFILILILAIAVIV